MPDGSVSLDASNLSGKLSVDVNNTDNSKSGDRRFWSDTINIDGVAHLSVQMEEE